MPPRKPAEIFVTTSKHIEFADFVQRLKDREIKGQEYREEIAHWRITHSEASN